MPDQRPRIQRHPRDKTLGACTGLEQIPRRTLFKQVQHHLLAGHQPQPRQIDPVLATVIADRHTDLVNFSFNPKGIQRFQPIQFFNA